MRRKTWRALAVAASFAAVTTLAQPATANPTDTAAISRYAEIAAETTLNPSTSPGDNITCDPKPVVEGRMLTPRAPIVVGEVYAHVEIAGHLKCVSLDTRTTYWLNGKVTDMYWRDGHYRASEFDWTSMDSVRGAATVNPFTIVQYAGGHPALNTWHYAYFEGWTSTGRYITGVSPLFYVSAV